MKVERAGLSGDVSVRRATMADAALMHAWRSDERIRAVSRQSGPIPFDDHVEWLEQALVRQDRCVLMALAGERPIGVVRFDRNGGEAEVSIYLDPELAGRGLGAVALHAGERFLAEGLNMPVTLVAETLPDNGASRRLFERAGYERTGNRFKKRLNPSESAHS